MSYFDLHCHPTFKYSLVTPRYQSNHPIEEPVVIEFKGVVASFRKLILWVFGDPLDSQSSISQLFEGESNLVSLTIYAIEHAYTRSSIIASLGCVSDTLDQTKIDDVREGRTGYWPQSTAQIEAIQELSQLPAQNGRRLRLITDFREYDPTDTGTLHILLNFEGGHCFYSGQANDDTDVLKNLIAFKKSGVRPLYITLVHHAQNALANHAFAVPAAWAGRGLGEGKRGGFNPTGEELTPLGRDFIDEALSERNGPPIYIDVKHMSLGSRLAYYELRRQKYPHIPIIASHVGVTGLSMHATEHNGEPIIRWVKRHDSFVEVKYNNIISFPRHIPGREPGGPVMAPTSVVTFNPWSINLYDEEITEILASDGLIGLSLDVRILGMGNDSHTSHEHEAERFSLNEQLFSVHTHLSEGHNDFEHLPDNRIQASLEHLDYFCNNLLHLVRVGRQTVGEAVWDHVCIGSDFDGLIVSVEFRNNRRLKANHIPEMRKKLKQRLPLVARQLNVPLQPAGMSQDAFIETVLDKLFFRNANRFLNEYFTVATGATAPLA